MSAWKFTRGNRWTIIAAPSWFDARRHAEAVLPAPASTSRLPSRVAVPGEELTFEMETLPDGREIQVVHDDSDAHYVLRWVGSDAGPYPNRHLVVDDGEE